MNKITTLILFFFIVTSLTAQMIPNGSFENVDSIGNVQNWKINRGVIKRSSAQFRLGYPFTAIDQGFFISIENDTNLSPVKTGAISNTFQMNAVPPTLVFNTFYAPSYLNQRYGIEVLFTKWRNNIRDTIMYKIDSIRPVLDSLDRLLIRWTEKRLDLRSGYRDTTIPDSATITIQNDIVPPFSNTTFLLVDNFQFSTWKVGINNISTMREFIVFPNPANDLINLGFVLNEKENIDIRICDLQGRLVKEIHEQSFNMGQNEYRINVADIASGLYFINLATKQFSIRKKFILLR